MLAFGRGKKRHYTCVTRTKKRKKPPAIYIAVFVAGFACLGNPGFSYGEKGAVPSRTPGSTGAFEAQDDNNYPLASYGFEQSDSALSGNSECNGNSLPTANIGSGYSGLIESPVVFNGRFFILTKTVKSLLTIGLSAMEPGMTGIPNPRLNIAMQSLAPIRSGFGLLTIVPAYLRLPRLRSL